VKPPTPFGEAAGALFHRHLPRTCPAVNLGQVRAQNICQSEAKVPRLSGTLFFLPWAAAESRDEQS
jgi:hypothetical protein